MTRHIYLGQSRDHSWCGLYVGIHNPKAAIIESDYIDKRAMGLLSTVCRNCRRSFDAAERREAA